VVESFTWVCFGAISSVLVVVICTTTWIILPGGSRRVSRKIGFVRRVGLLSKFMRLYIIGLIALIVALKMSAMSPWLSPSLRSRKYLVRVTPGAG
jgi:hypothetical protein